MTFEFGVQHPTALHAWSSVKLRGIATDMFTVPVNLKDRDAFHISIEEYLQALISLIEELARLAINSVTLGDYQRPLQISQFVKDLHAGFQILNLKNDSLRRRSDSIKYSVKKIEDVVYDLSLRNLVSRATPSA
jgi:predicted translin family RNA/ssDNA-binding protein